eukprot:15481321-Alexandrium_andersonii.AAC.1
MSDRGNGADIGETAMARTRAKHRTRGQHKHALTRIEQTANSRRLRAIFPPGAVEAKSET